MDYTYLAIIFMVIFQIYRLEKRIEDLERIYSCEELSSKIKELLLTVHKVTNEVEESANAWANASQIIKDIHSKLDSKK